MYRALMVVLVGVWLAGEAFAAPWDYGNIIGDYAATPTEEVLQLAHKEESAKNLDKALVLYMLICGRDTTDMSDGEKELVSQAYFRAGYINYQSGRYPKALEFNVKGLQICESTKQKRDAARFYKDIGIIYSAYNDFEKGLHYMRKGEEALKSNPDPDTEYKLLTNIFFNLFSLNKIDEAKATLQSLSKVAKHPTDTTRYMDGYVASLILYSDGRYGEAASNLRELADFARSTGIGPDYECHAYKILYHCYRMTNRLDSAFKYMKVCRDISDSNGLQHKFASVLLSMADYYESRGDRREAEQYKALYFSQVDSIFNDREFASVKNLQENYEMEKIDTEIRQLNEKERERATTIYYLRWIIGIVTVAVIAVSGLLVWVYRQKRRLDESYRHLYELNRRLTENHEREVARYQQCVAGFENREKREERGREMEVREERKGVERGRESEARGIEREGRGEREKEGRDGRVCEGREKRGREERGREERVGEEKGRQEGEEERIEKRGEVSRAETSRYTGSNLSVELNAKLISEISNVMEHTEEYCSDSFTLDRLAELVGSNTKYVSQAINGSFGKNFSNYVNEYRIRKACLRLADFDRFGTYTISAIGQSVGFKSNTTFTAVFRKLTGMTPSVYQKIGRQERAHPNSKDPTSADS